MEAQLSLVSIVVVTWNSARFLPRCLTGLTGQSHRPVEYIAVDNASSDGSAELVQAALPGCAIIRNGRNLGFSAAVNQAVAIASGEFVLLCNPDAYLEAEYIQRLLTALAAAGPQFGAATGTLMRATGDDIVPTGIVDTKGIRMTRTGRHLDIGQGRRDGEDVRGLKPLGGSPDTVHEVFGVSGAAPLFRMTFIRDVSIGPEFLDEDFFAYREDADVGWRGRILGWRALSAADAVGHHVRRVTPERRRQLDPSINMHSVKNRFLLRLKNESAYLAIRNAPFELTRDLVTIGAVLTVERTSLPALIWLWRNRHRVAEKRRAVQRRRRVGDRELAEWFR